MTNHPSIQRKLRDHILERIPELQDRPPDFNDMNATSLPYLEAVIYETLRTSRMTPSSGRQLFDDMVILGRRVPKGTFVLMPTVTGWDDTHEKGRCWKAGTGREFLPERWLDADGKFDSNAGPSGLPFALGERSCFGKQLGVGEALDVS